MKTIETLRRERGEIVAQIKALADLEASGTALSDEQLAQFANLEAQANQISAAIARQESTERLMAQQAVPVNAHGSQAPPAVHVKQELKQYPGAGMARLAMAVAAGQGDMKLAEQFAANEIGDAEIAMAISTAAGSGGALVPENLHSEVIELLRPRTIVRKLGACPVPLPSGNLSMPRMSGGATSSYVGEGVDAKATGGSFDDVKLAAKTIFTQLVPAARTEVPAVDLTAAGELASLVDSGKGLVSFNTAASIAPSRGLFLGSGAKPGSVTITIGAAVITDRGGELVVAGSVIGSIDYGRGSLEFNAQCPNYGIASKAISFWPAARPLRIADTARIEIKANNRGYAYTITLQPTPAPGTLTVSFMAQGKWYDLKDNGRGELRGADLSYGSGTLNFASDSVLLTRPLSHAYSASDSYVSSALIMGNLWARYTSLFDQRTWTNKWQDYVDGDQSTAQYNDTDYPLLLTNRATIEERWAIIFQSSTSFVLVGDHVGQIALGDVNTDFAPANPNNGQPSPGHRRRDRRHHRDLLQHGGDHRGGDSPHRGRL